MILSARTLWDALHERAFVVVHFCEAEANSPHLPFHRIYKNVFCKLPILPSLMPKFSGV